MAQAHRGLRRKLAETIYLIDATGVRLTGYSADWARFSAGVCGAKVHVIYDADADRPIYAAVSAANVTDISVAQQMPIEPEPPMSSTSVTTIMAGGRSSTRRNAAS